MGTFGISPSFPGLSQSSGWVTHVLLTRSRLCPGASPGSSLHLHVLSTPPAFVLSQDQTLREETAHVELSVRRTRGRSYTWSEPGRIDGVLRYCSFSGRRSAEAGGGSNLDAHRRIGLEAGPSGAHAVEFSKTVAPCGG